MGIPILYRYIMRETVARFFAIIIILLAIILSFRLSRLLSAAVNGDMALNTVWRLIALKAMYILTILIPIAFILATVITLTRLYRHQEMSAIFAGGISRAHIHRIVLVLTLPTAAVLLFLNLQIMPNIYRQNATLHNQARQQAGFALLSENNFQRLDDGSTIHTGAQSESKYADFFINQETLTQSSAIFAEQGSIINKNNEQYLILENGVRVAWDKDNALDKANYTDFKRAEIHIPGAEESSGDKLRNIPTSELTKSREHRAEWQNRFNPVIAMLVFSFCLPMIAHSKPRRERQYKFLPAFLIFAFYLNALETTVKFVGKGTIPIFPGSFSIHAGAMIILFFWWLSARNAL